MKENPHWLKGWLRRAIACCLLQAAGFGQAVNPAPPSNAPAAKEDPNVLPVFEVKETEGSGYISHEARSGFKTSKPLLEIPQAITVIPRDVIDDVAQFRNESDIVSYAAAGVVSEHDGNQPHMRGFRSNVILEDGMWDHTFNNADSAVTESYEVIRGPAAVLFGGRPTLAGVIVRNTKRPQMKRGFMARTILGTDAFYRGELDATGPITKDLFGTGGRLAYRLVGFYQRSDGFPRGNRSDRRGIHPMLDLTFGRTHLQLQGEVAEQVIGGQSNGFFDQAGKGLYIRPGGSRDEAWKETWSEATFRRDKARFSLQHDFGNGWNAKLILSHSNTSRFDDDIRNTTVPNWNTMTLAQQYFINFDYVYYDAAAFDVIGKYNLWGFRHESFIGLSSDRYDSYKAGRVTRNLTPLSLLNPVLGRPKPTAESMWAPNPVNTPNVGTGISEYSSFSYSHSIDVVPKRFSLVAGVGYNSAEVRDYASPVNGGALLSTEPHHLTTRRLGAVYRPHERVSVFGNNQTTFAPQGAQDFFGNFLPPTIGEVSDLGVKVSLPNEKIVGMVTFFRLLVTGLSVVDFAHPGFRVSAGKQVNDGFEFEMQFRPIPSLQIVTTYYKGDIRDYFTGEQLNNSVNETASLLLRYDFRRGPLNGLRAGAALYRQGPRRQTATVGWPAFTVTNVFLSYRFSERLRCQLNVQNLEDKFYSPGGLDMTRRAAYGAPLNAKLTTTVRF